MSAQGLGMGTCMRATTDVDEGDLVRTMSSGTAHNAPAPNRLRYNRGRVSLSARPAPFQVDPALLATPGALRRRRTMQPPPPFRNPDPRASLSAFLTPSALPADCRPESVDVTFKAHLALLRRLTNDPFEAHNRFLFVHKPLARVNAVLAGALMSVPDSDMIASGGLDAGMSAELRAAVMYVACNSFRNVYGMALAGQMTSIYKSGIPPDGFLSGAIINGLGLSTDENAALDFAQELATTDPSTLDSSLRLALNGGGFGRSPMRQLLERQVASVVSYAAFMCRMMGALDVELSYEAVKYAAANLSHSLQWSSAGRHFNFEGIENVGDDVGPVREATPPRRRRFPNLISSSVTVPRLLSEATRAQDGWLKAAWIPKPGKLLEMNDLIKSCFGFYPFYFSVGAVLGEAMRRALLFGVKELLFVDGETSRRLKFLVCYVTSYKRMDGSETRNPRPMPRATSIIEPQLMTPRRRLPRRGSLDVILEEEDGAPGRQNGPTQDYDPAAIITAHAAFLATRYGATPAELIAAVDENSVKEAMGRYMTQPNDNPEMTAYPVKFPLTMKDCAAVLMGHALARSPADMSAEVLQFMESSFSGTTHMNRGRGGRTSHRATLEVLGAASMWGLLERYCAGATTFNVDWSANLYFAGGPAEPAICSFAAGPVGREIGLSLSSAVKTPEAAIERTMTYRNATLARSKNSQKHPRKRSVSFLSGGGSGLRLWGRR